MTRYYQTQAPTIYSTLEAPEDKSPLELRPSLEKGEETHVRDCLVWHGKSPRYTYRNHGYRMYTHNGQDYWTSEDCGNPGCRTCVGSDHLIHRDVGYLRRNELGRTVDRGFSSKPWKLRLRDGELDNDWAQRYEPSPYVPDTARSGYGGGMRDPFNRPVDGAQQQQPWAATTKRYDYDNAKPGCTGCSGSRGGNCCGNGSYGNGGCKDCSPGYNNINGGYKSARGGPTVGSTDPYDMTTYRQTFPRIDERDQGSVTYRPPMTYGYDEGPRPGQGPIGGSQTYRPPPAASDYPQMNSGYQTAATSNPMMGGGGGGGAPARGNDAVFERKEDPMSKKTAGPRRELKGQNTAVAFTV